MDDEDDFDYSAFDETSDDLIDSEKISTFMAITGADTQQGTQFLEMSKGDLDMAVGLFLETNQNTSSMNNHSAGTDPIPAHPRAPIAPVRDTLTHDFGSHQNFDIRGTGIRLPMSSAFHAHDESRSLSTSPTNPFAQRSNSRPIENDTPEGRLAKMFAPPYNLIFKGDFESVFSFSPLIIRLGKKRKNVENG